MNKYKPDPKYPGPRRLPPSGPMPQPRKRRKWLRRLTTVSVSLILVVIVLNFLIQTFYMHSYRGLNGDLVARTYVSSTSLPGIMAVKLIVYDSNGHPVNDINCYAKQGSTVVLKGDIVKFWSWLNLIGLHEGYKMTRLEGCYRDLISLEHMAKPETFVLNGGDDAVFKMVHGQTWMHSVAEADYSHSFSLKVNQLPADQSTKVYDVFTSQQDLYTVPPK